MSEHDETPLLDNEPVWDVTCEECGRVFLANNPATEICLACEFEMNELKPILIKPSKLKSNIMNNLSDMSNISPIEIMGQILREEDWQKIIDAIPPIYHEDFLNYCLEHMDRNVVELIKKQLKA